MSKGAELVEDEIRRHVVGLTPDIEIKEGESVIKTKCYQPPIWPQQQAAITIEVSASPLQECVFKKIIPGKDGRVRVNETHQWPDSVHGVVVIRFPGMPDDTHAWGTGALIAPNIVLTAAHNLYQAKYGGRASSVRFLPAVNRKALPFGEPHVEDWCYPAAYTKDKSEDYGILILDRPLGEETGYFGLSVLPPQALKALTISISGYPGDKVAEKDREYELWGMEGAAHAVNSDYIEYVHDTAGGQSGSLVVVKIGNNYYGVGIHVLGDSARGINQATLLTKARYEQVNAWVRESLHKRIHEIAVEGVQKINLSTKSLDNAAAQELARYHLPNLTKLDLSGNNIGDVGAQALAQSFASGKTPALKKVNLFNNRIGDVGAQALADTFVSGKTPALAKMFLGNNIGNVGAQALAEAFASGKVPAFGWMGLKGTRIGSVGDQSLRNAGFKEEYGIYYIRKR